MGPVSPWSYQLLHRLRDSEVYVPLLVRLNCACFLESVKINSWFFKVYRFYRYTALRTFWLQYTSLLWFSNACSSVKGFELSRVSGVQGWRKSSGWAGSLSQGGDKFFPLEEDDGVGLHRSSAALYCCCGNDTATSLTAQSSPFTWQPDFMNPDCNLIITFFFLLP